MKGLIGLAIVGIIGVGVTWWVMAQFNKDPGEPVMIGLGNSSNGKVELHVCIQMPMTKRSPMGGRGRPKDWDEWLAKHFFLKSDTGDELTWRFAARSNLIPDDKAGGLPEGYAYATLKEGATYTLDYKPWLEEDARYRYTFKAVETEKKRSRVTFEPVKK